jgi:hypothetical protein
MPWRISPMRIFARYLPSSALELEAARVAALDRGDSGEAMFDFGERQGRFRIVRAQLQEHLDRITEIGRGGKDLLALILATGERRGDFPDRASADLQALLAALWKWTSDHEARCDLRFGGIELRQELTREFRHLQSALGLSQGEADEREVVETAHATQDNSQRRDITPGSIFRMSSACVARDITPSHFKGN